MHEHIHKRQCRHSAQHTDGGQKTDSRWLCEHDIVLEQSFAERLRALAASHKKTAAS